MGIKVANNANATLAASITSSATSITVTTGQGARFPTLSAGDYFYATLIDVSNNLEIVKVTARSTDVLTVVRAQESTTARAYSTGDRIELRLTAQTFTDATTFTPTITQVSDQINSSTGYLDIPSGTTAQRPASPGSGMMRFNTTDNKLEIYDGSNWVQMSLSFVATGGTIVTSGAYKYHIFTSSGTLTVSAGTVSAEALIIAGGGSGAGDGGTNLGNGGGGAGGLLYVAASTLTVGTYTVTVGAGGAGAYSNNRVSGSNSVFNGSTAIGGGGGGFYANNSGANGGSGGGGGATSGGGGSGTAGQGNSGASGGSNYGGGGGGASASGSGNTGGAGSNTYSAWATATSTGVSGYFAGGGGGSGASGNGSGGAGGGGAGGTVGVSGTANTGSGGGGQINGGATSGSGGSGIVIIRYMV